MLTAYLDYMEELGMLLGGQPASTREQMRKVLELEIQLANITVPQDQRRDEEKIYRKMSIAELQVGPAGNRDNWEAPAPGADLSASLLRQPIFLRQPILFSFPCLSELPSCIVAILERKVVTIVGHLSRGHPLVPFLLPGHA